MKPNLVIPNLYRTMYPNKKFLSFLFFMFMALVCNACPVCEKQQPKILKGISHGAGPDGQLDYIIISIAVIIVLLTLFYTIKWLIRPGEKSKEHIKQFILNAD